MKPDLVFLPRFSSLGASSRYRCFQFLPHLRREGIIPQAQPLFSGRYLRHRYQGNGWPLGIMARDYQRRIRFLRDLPADIPLWIEKELFPWIPGGVERAFLKKRRYLLDLDDAVHLWYNPYPVLRRKLGILAEGASAVHAGNAFLADECRAFQNNIQIIPTVLDPDEYRTRTGRAAPNRLVVGWIGGPLSQSHLEDLLPVLESLPDIPIRLDCMGVASSFRTSLPHKLFPWTSQAEKEFCAQIDVGIMPLSDSAFSKGKCGFKLLQYMSAGAAVIATASLANREILEDGRCGILASSASEWREALAALHRTPGLLEKYGTAGASRVRAAYSLKTWSPVWVDSMRSLLAGKPSSAGLAAPTSLSVTQKHIA